VLVFCVVRVIIQLDTIIQMAAPMDFDLRQNYNSGSEMCLHWDTRLSLILGSEIVNYISEQEYPNRIVICDKERTTWIHVPPTGSNAGKMLIKNILPYS